MIPEPAAPEPKQTPEEVWKQPDESAIPFANVEVAVEEELIPPPTWRRPAMLTLLLKVLDAVEVRPANWEKPEMVRPPENVEEAEEEIFKFPVELIEPPVIVRPAEEARPAEEIPPANVEVAVEEELSPLFRMVRPETLNLPAIVEEAFEKRPPEELTLKRDVLAEERALM